MSCVWLLLLAASCGRTAQGEQPVAERVVRIGYQKIGAPFLLKARADSLLSRLRDKHANVEWLEFQHGPALLEAMRASAVDLGYVGETPPVFAQASDVPFVYVATEPPAPQGEAILVPKGSTITKLEDLRGKRVALNRGSNVHYLALQALSAARLQLSDIELTFLAPADARAAFDAKQVDAWVIWDPFYAAAEQAGARVLHDGTDLVDNHQYYVARKEFAAHDADLLQLVLAEFDSLSDWAATHPQEAAKLSATSSGISYDALLSAEHRHAYGLRPITPDILAKQQKIAEAFLRAGVLPRSIETARAYLNAAGYSRQ